jgi:hypothetical protein
MEWQEEQNSLSAVRLIISAESKESTMPKTMPQQRTKKNFFMNFPEGWCLE